MQQSTLVTTAYTETKDINEGSYVSNLSPSWLNSWTASNTRQPLLSSTSATCGICLGMQCSVVGSPGGEAAIGSVQGMQCSVVGSPGGEAAIGSVQGQLCV